MQALALTLKGMEDVAAEEVKELINADAIIKETLIEFPVNSYNDLCLLCYRAQSLTKVMLMLDVFPISKYESKIFTFPEDIIKKTETFCLRVSHTEPLNDDIEREFGGYLQEQVNKKVNLDDPGLLLHAHLVKDICYLGIDFSGKDLSKRPYKIFTQTRSLKGPVGYAAVKLAEVNKESIILDPLCGDGVISIEAALYLTQFPVQYYTHDDFAFLKYVDYAFPEPPDSDKIKITAFSEKFPSINATRKNAKIAGIHKSLHVTRVTLEDIDLKFEDHQVDAIVTFIPPLSKNAVKDVVIESYEMLFDRAKKVAKKMVLLSLTDAVLEDMARSYNFKLKEKRSIFQGQEEIFCFVFEKK
jgi:23S rRNA G2445 N2-methylase RlmL